MALSKIKPLSGNKGEWSEVYVFLKLLAQGTLTAADADLNAISSVFYPVIKILREELEGNYDYVINGNIKIYDQNSALISTIPTIEFIQKSEELYSLLSVATGKAFSFPTIESFLKSIHVNKLTALTTNKADIQVVIHDVNTGLKPQLGFSIKSMLGKDSTLFNPGPGTNFIYKLIPKSTVVLNVNQFNAATLAKSKVKPQKSKITLRINELENLGYEIKFHKIQSDTLMLNLELIDSHLPEILAQMLYYKYKTQKSKLSALTDVLIKENPMRYNLTMGHPFYELKIKSFLTESAVGMTAEKVWTGIYDATGGVIIVKKLGDLVCYHIYNRNEFQTYLTNYTKFEQASTSEDESNPGHARVGKSAKPYKWGWVYEENNELFIKLNLQIRFINPSKKTPKN